MRSSCTALAATGMWTASIVDPQDSEARVAQSEMKVGS